MNQILFERSTGNVGPNEFAKLHTSQLIRSFQPAPHFRFDGGERGAVGATGNGDVVADGVKTPLWAHQAGVNALALDRFDGRM